MDNFWINNSNKVLRHLGYDYNTIMNLSEKEKETIITEEYLYRIRMEAEDFMCFSVDEMAEFLVGYYRSFNAHHEGR